MKTESKHYRITGLGNRFDKFFEVCRAIHLIIGSWPDNGPNGYEGTWGKAFNVHLSHTIPHSEFLLHTICSACELKCDTIESESEKELKECKEMLRFFLVAAEMGCPTFPGKYVEILRRLSK